MFASPRIFKFAKCEYYSRLCVLGDFISGGWGGGEFDKFCFDSCVFFWGDSGEGVGKSLKKIAGTNTDVCVTPHIYVCVTPYISKSNFVHEMFELFRSHKRLTPRIQQTHLCDHVAWQSGPEADDYFWPRTGTIEATSVGEHLDLKRDIDPRLDRNTPVGLDNQLTVFATPESVVHGRVFRSTGKAHPVSESVRL